MTEAYLNFNQLKSGSEFISSVGANNHYWFLVTIHALKRYYETNTEIIRSLHSLVFSRRVTYC